MILTQTGYEVCNKDIATHVMFNLPGPIPYRILPVITKGKREGTGNWSWNGDVDKPTVKPSILSRTVINGIDVICHSFINDGQIEFLSDSSHSLAGQKLDLLDIEE